MFIVNIFIISLLFGKSISAALCSVFNYEISQRVQDKVSDFLFLISNVLEVSNSFYMSGNIDLFGDANTACRNMFFPNMQIYAASGISSEYAGFETGAFINILRTIPFF